MTEAEKSSETSINIYQTARRNKAEGSHRQNRRPENLKSHSVLAHTVPRSHSTKEHGTKQELRTPLLLPATAPLMGQLFQTLFTHTVGAFHVLPIFRGHGTDVSNSCRNIQTFGPNSCKHCVECWSIADGEWGSGIVNLFSRPQIQIPPLFGLLIYRVSQKRI
jgi:hypothetical protein